MASVWVILYIYGSCIDSLDWSMIWFGYILYTGTYVWRL